MVTKYFGMNKGDYPNDIIEALAPIGADIEIKVNYTNISDRGSITGLIDYLENKIATTKLP